jgi:hypothetical protein
MIRHSLDEGLREPHAWLSRSRRFLRQSISGLLFYMEFLTITTALLAALLTAAYWNQHQQRYAALDRTVAVRAAAHRLQFGFAEGQASIQLLLADPHAGDGERQKAIALLRAAISLRRSFPTTKPQTAQTPLPQSATTKASIDQISAARVASQ